MVHDDASSKRRTLFHIVRPSASHDHTGARDSKYGYRIVPPAADVDDIIAWVRIRPWLGRIAGTITANYRDCSQAPQELIIMQKG